MMEKRKEGMKGRGKEGKEVRIIYKAGRGQIMDRLKMNDYKTNFGNT